jgi:hypothetical protein
LRRRDVFAVSTILPGMDWELEQMRKEGLLGE